MKKLLTVFALVVMLTAGTGVVGASDTQIKDSTTITVAESPSFGIMSKKPIKMD